MSSFRSSNNQFSYSQIDIVTYVTSCYRLSLDLQSANISYKMHLELLYKMLYSAEFQMGLGWSRPLLSLMSKYCMMILLITMMMMTLKQTQ